MANLEPEVDSFGNNRWKDSDGKLHRLDGPAVKRVDGYKAWWVEGELHRLDGPAVKRVDGYKAWWVEGELHRLDGPAVVSADGSRFWRVGGKLHRLDGPAVERVGEYRAWWVEGKLHRLDGPAFEYAGGRKEWWVGGKKMTEEEFMAINGPEVDSNGNKRWKNSGGELHRLYGPAIEWASGDKSWWVGGKWHRLDGPAFEGCNGSKAWWVEGKRHRLDGPAIEWASGIKEWWVEGKRMTEEGFMKTTKPTELVSTKSLDNEKVGCCDVLNKAVGHKYRKAAGSVANSRAKAEMTIAALFPGMMVWHIFTHRLFVLLEKDSSGNWTIQDRLSNKETDVSPAILSPIKPGILKRIPSILSGTWVLAALVFWAMLATLLLICL